MFSYQMGTQIEFGSDIITRLPEFLKHHRFGRRLFVVTDPGIMQAGLLTPVTDHLRNEGFTVQVYHQVAPNPRDVDCETGAGVYHDTSSEAIVAIGGGSAMDTAKAIALLSQTGGRVSDYVDGRHPYQRVAPLVCVPTTAGTGSEVTRSAVITESATHRKMTLKHALLRPVLAVLDPMLTVTVPAPITAATGVDALVHAIEGYTCTKSSPITQAFGAAAMKVLLPALPRVLSNPADVGARSDMLQGSLLAGLCFGAADVAAVHCLAEALGGLYDTPHGLANAVFLPHVLQFNVVGYEEIHAELSCMMGFSSAGTAPKDACAQLVEGVSRWVKDLGIPALRELPGVVPEDFMKIVELAYANGSTGSNIRPIFKDDYRDILERAYYD